MHYIIKKKEAERIDNENKKLLKNIVNTGPILSVKKMEADYRKREEWKRTIKRNKDMPVEKII
jgi:molybdenum-dependent DNA-binding transcriptional regulator ModE